MAPHGTLLVVGSGPGIGVNVAKVFAERGFQRVILASRSDERLAKEVAEVESAAGSAEVRVTATPIDLASKESVNAALGEWAKVLGEGPALEAVLFNAARVGPSKVFEFTEQEVERDMQVCRSVPSLSAPVPSLSCV